MFKKLLTVLFISAIFVLYFYATDPDTSVLHNIHFAPTVILTLAIFVISITGIALAEFGKDFFKNIIENRIEKQLGKKIEDHPELLGYAYIGDAITLLGYSIIIAASIIAYNMS